jgi:hypothetical protein
LNGNLVTLKGETYTPTDNTRVNFVGHGTDLNQEGAQSLADKAKIFSSWKCATKIACHF